MPLSNFPQAVIRFEIQAYQRPSEDRSLRETHVAFSGTPQKHPCNPERIVLVADPYSDSTFYYEFELRDISYVEELTSLINLDGEILPQVRVWVKKNSIAIRSTPFVVANTGPR